jgi:outer membrane protein insertion porin family
MRRLPRARRGAPAPAAGARRSLPVAGRQRLAWLVLLSCAAAARVEAQTPPPAAPAESAAPPSAPSEPDGPVPIPLAPPLAPTIEPGGEARESLAIRYLLERVEVRGNVRVRKGLIKSFVPFDTGHAFAVDDFEIDALRYRLLGTGWFDRVDLHLERGQERGWVLLVIDVEERRTLVFQQLAAGVGWSVEGAAGKEGGDSTARKAEPYLGLALAETNFLGTGNTLGGEVLVSRDQFGGALNFMSPVVRASRWSLRTRGSLVNGHEYFGGDKGVLVSVQCPEDELSEEDLAECQLRPPAAVVDYWRASLELGTAKDVGSFARLSLAWHGDYVYVPPTGLPAAASQLRGRGNASAAREPIDFAIEPDSSVVSAVSIGFTHDKRDSAVLPSRGTLAGFSGDMASRLLGSDYEFVRLELSVNHWITLPWRHVLRLGAQGGAVFGYAPFFYKFFVTDLTDLMPSRLLGLNLDHRPAPNLFGLIQCGKPYDSSCGTAVAQMRHEELAARVDLEYSAELVRGRRKFLKNADVFGLVGLYGLADPDDLRVSMPGYQGIARLPIDLTLDVGVRLDTEAGVFRIGLAQLGWLFVK